MVSATRSSILDAYYPFISNIRACLFACTFSSTFCFLCFRFDVDGAGYNITHNYTRCPQAVYLTNLLSTEIRVVNHTSAFPTRTYGYPKAENETMPDRPFPKIISGCSNTSSNYHSPECAQVELSISELIKWNQTTSMTSTSNIEFQRWSLAPVERRMNGTFGVSRKFSWTRFVIANSIENSLFPYLLAFTESKRHLWNDACIIRATAIYPTSADTKFASAALCFTFTFDKPSMDVHRAPNNVWRWAESARVHNVVGCVYSVRLCLYLPWNKCEHALYFVQYFVNR